MAYRKLTKAQYKNRNRTLAWLHDEPFRESSRDRNPRVPDLTVERVLEEYVPPDVTGAGQFFTPLEMGAAALSYLNLPGNSDGVRILDPCAGIGHLLYHLARYAEGGAAVDAYELEEECVQIGRKLFPRVNWHWKIPFDHVDEIEGRYDYVVCNPPFNTRRGMASGERMCGGRCCRSHHVFLELCVRALKPGGQALILAPYNYVQQLPSAAKSWLTRHGTVENSWGPLPGEFALTSTRVHAWYFMRHERDALDGVCERMAERRQTLPVVVPGHPEIVQLTLF